MGRKKKIKYLCKNCFKIINLNEDDEKYCPGCKNKLNKRDIYKGIKYLKNKVWKEFSYYVRIKGCLETTGNINEGICFTCKKVYPFSKLQAGHMVQGRTNGVLFDEENVKIQCYVCNVMKNGEQGLFVLNKIKELYLKNNDYEESLKIVEDSFNNKYKEINEEYLLKLYKKYSELNKKWSR